MQYENRQPTEGLNTSTVHPLRQFLQLAFGAVLMVVLLVVFLQYAGAFAARRIPFGYELRVMESLDIELGEADRYPEITDYLNDLANRISQHLPIPEGMSVQVHYDSENVFNAFATVGGNLLFYRGLLARMPDENTLAMVMAHEISHVLHRDPVSALGGGIASSVALLGLTGNAGTGMAGQMLSHAGMLTGIQFTRSMEVAADDAALAAMNALYGHVNGAASLFELFRTRRGESSSGPRAQWLERFLSTHPLDEERIDRISQYALDKQWSASGKLTPLPADFERWLSGG